MHVVKISDGLGNQMFQYAFARKLQLISNKKVYLDTRFINHDDLWITEKKDSVKQKNDHREYGLNNFRIKLPELSERIWNKHIILPWRYRSENDIKRKDGIIKYHYPYSIYFKGYFFDLTYYDDIKETLQSDFRVKKPFCLPAKINYIIKYENTVSLHVRKGDFVRNHRDISRTQYYNRAISCIHNLVEQPVFFVFSDDINWVKSNMKIPGKKLYISQMGFDDYQELTIMKHCKYNIIANSTFSYWAAYLNDYVDKKVISPKHWKPDIIPKDWITL